MNEGFSVVVGLLLFCDGCEEYDDLCFLFCVCLRVERDSYVVCRMACVFTRDDQDVYMYVYVHIHK